MIRNSRAQLARLDCWSAVSSKNANSSRILQLECVPDVVVAFLVTAHSAGRLVLADGVAYAAKDLGSNLILDMATLTGAQMVATGQRHAAVITNNAEMETVLVAAGRCSGDLTWPLPFCPEFFRGEFTSRVADMKNSVKNRANAQTSCAAQFIADNLPVDYAGLWAHIDMAGPAMKDGRATGYGVALLVQLLGLTS